jgi:cytochrome c oxidase subunit 1
MRYGRRAGPNPWDVRGLEWETSSPPPTENFLVQPVVTDRTYEYGAEEVAKVV